VDDRLFQIEGDEQEVVLKAMLIGTIPIAARVCGVPEIARDSSRGILVHARERQ